MIFKSRRINKLKIKVAVFKEASDFTACFINGDTTSYFVDKHEENLKELAGARAELLILEAKS